MNADEVATNLWIGAVPTEPEKVDKEFDALVLAAKEFQDVFPEHKFPCTELIRAPLIDGKPTAAEKAAAMKAGLRVYELNKDGKKVLVTCAKGVNRSSLIAALAMVIGGVNMPRALGNIRKHRRASSGAKPLFNTYFVDLIRALSDAVSNRKS